MQRLLLQNSEEDVASSLLGTPYMATQASHPKPPMTTPRRVATAPHQQEEQEVTYDCIASHVAYTPGGSHALVAIPALSALHTLQTSCLKMHGLLLQMHGLRPFWSGLKIPLHFQCLTTCIQNICVCCFVVFHC